MLGLPLAFAAPAALVALAGLPVLYVLLQVLPPRPVHMPFPPLRLILDLKPQDETPAHTPWWLLALRLAIAAAIVLAMAAPIWNPVGLGLPGSGPLLIVMDDGWSAAPDWDRRVAVAMQRIEAARQASRPVALAAISDAGRDAVPGDPGKAIERLRALKPRSYTPDRAAEAPAIARFVSAHADTAIVWIADGLERGGARGFAEAVAALPSPVAIVMGDRSVLALAGPRNGSGGLEVRVLRAGPGTPEAGTVRAFDRKGLAVAQAPFVFPDGARETTARFDLPGELRNDIVRLDIAEGRSAGAVTLLDARWKRRRVGIVSGDTIDTAQPLLAPNYYLAKALRPFADVREPKADGTDPVAAMLDDKVSVLILADVGTLSGSTHDRIARFVEDGGVLVRFAGPRLSNAADDLVPVRLRRGGRVLGGSLSWETPKTLAAIDASSPFAGLKVPPEVTVNRQVLAEPDAGLPSKTWAQLADGTPLVTAEARGKGRIVLFHVTADTTWSNLPLSGLFVDMLRRTVAVAGEAPGDPADPAAHGAEVVAPSRILDGFGVLGAPPSEARPIPAAFAGPASAEHPAGFYGGPDAPIAVNTLEADAGLALADLAGLRFQTASLRTADPIDLRPWLIVVAFLLFVADTLAALLLAGRFPRLPRRAAVAGLVACLAVGSSASPPPARADTVAVAPGDMAAALQTRLAYVVSGDAKADEISRQGLSALSAALAARTSLAPGEPVGVDPAKDELAFYPLIYWPIVAGRPKPLPAAAARIAAFMRQGGTIVFDTRDALTARPGGAATPEAAWLRDLLADIDVPALEPVPPDHVVTKTFYLIDSFVGRYAAASTWIEALPPAGGEAATRPVRSGDGVSPILVTGNDLAGGWAADDYGEALYPLTPGDPRQHEMALRGGINLVMYTLTGNYKADQVHIRDLLQRLAH